MKRLSVLFVLACTTAAYAETPTVDRADLRRALAEQRKLNLKNFHAYRRKGVYPHNSYQEGLLNVWKDADNHLCAVATLIHDGGDQDLVDAVATAENFVKTADLQTGPLMDWVLTSGFTQEEIVMIQQPTEEDVRMMEAMERAEARKIKRAIAREDRRLAKIYRQVEDTLKADRISDAGLDLATARLADHPDLAAKLIEKFPAAR
ncbi:MAG: hypothetical protein QM831_40470 [Kofleriaceae bacterium]